MMDDTNFQASGSWPDCFGDRGGVQVQRVERHAIEPVVESFYRLMRQIYVEQVWRESEQSATELAEDQGKTTPAQ
jgi:hypothetical protein